jgi:excisionase family DNA binding protein
MAKSKPRTSSEVTPQVMTTGEVAKWLRIHYTTVYRLVRQGKIPGAFKIGSDWRFRRDAIERWLKQEEAPRT